MSVSGCKLIVNSLFLYFSDIQDISTAPDIGLILPLPPPPPYFLIATQMGKYLKRNKENAILPLPHCLKHTVM